MRRRGARPVALFGSTTKTARPPITATSQHNKAMRGTKRVCHACEVRFYDLSRDPIVCPLCGVQHVPAAHRVEVGTRVAPFAGKTGWRGKGGFKRPDPEPDVAPEVAATEDASERAIGSAPNEDVLLEQEPDEEDVSGLVGHHVAEPKER